MSKATPAVRALAEEYGLDLTNIEGTGKSGYILKVDVEARLEATLNAANDAQPPFIPTSDRSDVLQLDDRSPEEATALVSGVVLPVSLLPKMRFRQDDAEGQEWAGDDLLALRRKTAGGRYRSNDGILGWFVSDRGFFVDPDETPPQQHENGHEIETQEPIEQVEPGASTFGVTE